MKKEGDHAQRQMVVESCPERDTWGISMQPVLTEMAMSHVLVLTTVDEKMEAAEYSLTFRKVGG